MPLALTLPPVHLSERPAPCATNETQRSFPQSTIVGRRCFSSEVAKSSGGGAGFFARVGSFLVGAGVTALATEVYIFKEVREGNLEMLKKQRELEKRIAALEKK